MGSPKPFDGFPSRTEAIAAMRQQKLDTVAIAHRLGITPKNVRDLEYSAEGRAPSTVHNRTVVFPVEVLERARVHASRRGLSINELCRRIVEQAIDDGMVDAILDDRPTAEGSR